MVESFNIMWDYGITNQQRMPVVGGDRCYKDFVSVKIRFPSRCVVPLRSKAVHLFVPSGQDRVGIPHTKSTLP